MSKLEKQGRSSQPRPEKMYGYSIIEKLGEGTFATVYLIDYDGVKKALRVPKNNKDEVGINSSLEFDVFTRIRHPHLMWAEKIVYDEKEKDLALILPYMNRSFLTLIEESKTDIHTRLKLAFQIFCAANHLLQNNIIHLDIKPTNILIQRVSKTNRKETTESKETEEIIKTKEIEEKELEEITKTKEIEEKEEEIMGKNRRIEKREENSKETRKTKETNKKEENSEETRKSKETNKKDKGEEKETNKKDKEEKKEEEEDIAVLSDFGMAVRLDDINGKVKLTDATVSINFRPYELLTASPSFGAVGEFSLVWQLAVLLFYMLTGRYFGGQKSGEVLVYIEKYFTNNRFPNQVDISLNYFLESKISDETIRNCAVDLLRGMLNINIETRFTLARILTHSLWQHISSEGKIQPNIILGSDIPIVIEKFQQRNVQDKDENKSNKNTEENKKSEESQNNENKDQEESEEKNKNVGSQANEVEDQNRNAESQNSKEQGESEEENKNKNVENQSGESEDQDKNTENQNKEQDMKDETNYIQNCRFSITHLLRQLLCYPGSEYKCDNICTGVVFLAADLVYRSIFILHDINTKNLLIHSITCNFLAWKMYRFRISSYIMGFSFKSVLGKVISTNREAFRYKINVNDIIRMEREIILALEGRLYRPFIYDTSLYPELIYAINNTLSDPVKYLAYDRQTIKHGNKKSLPELLSSYSEESEV